MGLTWAEIEPAFRRNLQWMRGDVQGSFDKSLNIATVLQVCSYTESLARLRAGTVVEFPSDGPKVYTDFMRDYFTVFGADASGLGRFYVCKNRQTSTVCLVDAYEAFYKLWRHGVVHEYLAKGKSYVSRTSTDGNQPYLMLRANRRGPMAPDGHHTKRLHIHLDSLVSDFIGAATSFEHDVLVSAPRSLLRRNCRRRFQFMVK